MKSKYSQYFMCKIKIIFKILKLFNQQKYIKITDIDTTSRASFQNDRKQKKKIKKRNKITKFIQ